MTSQTNLATINQFKAALGHFTQPQQELILTMLRFQYILNLDVSTALASLGEKS